MLNRLEELRRLNPEVAGISRSSVRASLVTGIIVDDFFPNIDEVNQSISEIRKQSDFIISLTFKLNNVVETEEEAQLNRQVTEKSKEVHSMSVNCKDILKSIHRENVKMEAKQDETRAGELKIRLNIYHAVLEKLGDSIGIFQKAFDDFNLQFRNRTKRVIKILYPDASENDLEVLVDMGADSSIISKTIMSKTDHAAENRLADLKDILSDVKLLEVRIREVHENILMLNEVVHQNDEIIEEVSENVEKTAVSVEGANEEIFKAATFKRSADRNKILLIIGITVGVIILAIVLWIYLGNPFSSSSSKDKSSQTVVNINNNIAPPSSEDGEISKISFMQSNGYLNPSDILTNNNNQQNNANIVFLNLETQNGQIVQIPDQSSNNQILDVKNNIVYIDMNEKSEFSENVAEQPVTSVSNMEMDVNSDSNSFMEEETDSASQLHMKLKRTVVNKNTILDSTL